MPVARQQLRKHATIPEPSLGNVPMEQWRDGLRRCSLCGPFRGDITSPEKAVRRAGGWCEMAASLKVSQSRAVERGSAGRQLRVAEAGS
jgi:hypothetical protein